MNFGDLLAFLVSGELTSEGAGEFGPQEECALGGALMEGAGSRGAFLLVEDGEVAGDVLANSLDLGKLGSTAGGGLSVSEVPELLLEAVNVSPDSLDVTLSDLFVDLLFHHLIIFNQYYLIY